MALPAAVERAGRLADEAYEREYGKPGEPPPQQPTNTETQPQQPAPAPTPAKPDEAQTPAPVTDSWEARYKVLHGKYNAEVPRLAAENRTLKADMGTLTDQMGTLKKQIEDLQSKAPTESLIKPEEIQEFGEPLVDMSRRAGQEAAARATAPMQRELSEVRTELTDLKKSNAEIAWQNFIDLLTNLQPDWAQINVNTEFLTWLDGTDDLAGVPRQILLDRAKDARDAPRVARFFAAWSQGHQKQATNSRNALESHVVPDSSSRTVVPSGKQILTRGQIQHFYNMVRAGQISQEDEIVMEAEINAAVAEGRVR